LAVYFQKREVVVPGQLLAEGRYRASYGTYYESDKVYSSLVGLAELRGNTVKVVALEGAYIPKEGDLVIGIITMVAGNNWKLDIGGPYGASLHANNALRRPYADDISEYMDIGDVISAEVQAFDRVSGPFLTMKGRGLQVLEGGMILEVSPAKIPRIIGRRGSMINMINDLLRIDSMVGQNGRIWIKADDVEIVRLAIKAFKTIEEQAHTSNLTDRINTMLTEEMNKIRGSKTTQSSDTKPKSTVEDEAVAEGASSSETEDNTSDAEEDESELDIEVEIENIEDASDAEEDQDKTEEVNE